MDHVRLAAAPSEAREMARVSLSVAGATTVGPTRQENQDAVVVGGMLTQESGRPLLYAGNLQEFFLAAVVDGMGGYEGGRMAASLVATRLTDIIPDGEGAPFDAWVTDLSKAVANVGRVCGAPNMGAAFAMVALVDEGVFLANVGDCRIYRKIGQYSAVLSEDDRVGDGSSALSQAVGGCVDLDAHSVLLPYGVDSQRFIICSDGVWETLRADELVLLCDLGQCPEQATLAVVSACESRGAKDNCSVIVLDIVVG